MTRYKYMSKSYQYHIELTFLEVSQRAVGYLNARNKLAHFKKDFDKLDAFAIYTLAVENQRIINAKIPVEYYKNKDFTNNRKENILKTKMEIDLERFVFHRYLECWIL